MADRTDLFTEMGALQQEMKAAEAERVLLQGEFDSAELDMRKARTRIKKKKIELTV